MGVTALLDTSVFVAMESGRPLDMDRLPAEMLVCVVTVAELEMGVLAAPDLAIRSQRLQTLQTAKALLPLVIDGPVTTTWALLRSSVAEVGRAVRVNDLWIAATARAHGLAVVTQDDDFDVLAELGLVEVVKV